MSGNTVQKKIKIDKLSDLKKRSLKWHLLVLIKTRKKKKTIQVIRRKQTFLLVTCRFIKNCYKYCNIPTSQF